MTVPSQVVMHAFYTIAARDGKPCREETGGRLKRCWCATEREVSLMAAHPPPVPSDQRNDRGTAPPEGMPTDPPVSRVSGGGGERDLHHAHTPKRS
jgi:hypothetical protein